jgi:hypothetical protein
METITISMWRELFKTRLLSTESTQNKKQLVKEEVGSVKTDRESRAELLAAVIDELNVSSVRAEEIIERTELIVEYVLTPLIPLSSVELGSLRRLLIQMGMPGNSVARGNLLLFAVRNGMKGFWSRKFTQSKNWAAISRLSIAEEILNYRDS